MILTIAQTHIIWEEKEENIKKAEELIKEAAWKKSDLIAFPEMSFTGFSMNIHKTGETNSETIEKMKTLCLKYKIAIGFGWVKLQGDRAENHYTILSKEAKIRNDFIKLHPFSYGGEERYFLKGNAVISTSISDSLVGSLICYDLRFPEAFLELSKSASLILVPANWPKERAEHWKTLLCARAIENQVYIAGINCVGEIGGLFYQGDSAIFNPNGELIGGFLSGEGLITITITNDVGEYQKNFPVRRDRRPELYEKWRKNVWI